MNTNRAGKQKKACWRIQEKGEKLWTKEGRTFSEIQNMLKGFAHGWIAGVRWARRNQK
jgi:hypothetical protein